MVDIVYYTNALAEIYEIADRSKNVVKDYVLRNKLVCTLLNVFLDLVSISGILKNVLEHLERDLLVNAVLLGIEINISGDIHHAVADDLCFSFNKLDSCFSTVVCNVFLGFNLYESVINACLFDLVSFIYRNSLACISHNLAGNRIYNRLCKNSSGET